MRGSDPDAALYWYARMIEGGEEPLYIARRVVRFASEDIGMADSRALEVAQAATEAYRFLGTPEGELAIAHAIVYTPPRRSQLDLHGFRRGAAGCAEHGSFRYPCISECPDKAHEGTRLWPGIPVRS